MRYSSARKLKIVYRYLIDTFARSNPTEADDAAEGRDDRTNGTVFQKKTKQKGQNKERRFGSWGDSIKLCNSRAHYPEFSPGECKFGDKCKMGHDLRIYLKDGKRADMETFNGKCPIWEAYGNCPAGWKCRFVGSHSEEIEHEDGRRELILKGDPLKADMGIVNFVGPEEKMNLSRRKMDLKKSDQYNQWMEKEAKIMEKVGLSLILKSRRYARSWIIWYSCHTMSDMVICCWLYLSNSMTVHGYHPPAATLNTELT
jgi:tRNA-dihydrouridine synthase 3